MDLLVLKRISSTESGTPGVLLGVDDWPIGVTLEPQSPIIPEGIYICVPYFSPAHKHNCFLIQGVPGHDGVEAHIGNYVTDTKGCVLTAECFSNFKAIKMIEDSRIEFDILWQLYGFEGTISKGFRLAVRG